MALAFYFSPVSKMTASQYNECTARLKKAGAGNPAGRVYHAAFGTSDALAIFDVWTSQSAFDAFGQTLMPILQQLAIDPGQPHVMPVHNVIVPPAKRPRPAAKKAAPAKRAAPKKKAKKSPARRKGKKR